MSPGFEPVSIIVVARDRFSTTDTCLESLLAHTPESCSLTAVLGGAPKAVRDRLTKRFGSKVRFVFEERLLNPSQSRNIGLRLAQTRLTVLMDNDVFVRPNWLEPLVACQQETGASLVVPIILETPTRIHTAGNRLYVTYQNGKAYANKELCFAKHTYLGSSNLKREPSDYAELHCQLVLTEPALRLEIFDEHMIEAGECDSALTLQKAGCTVWFEPASVVYFAFTWQITHAEDIRPFIFKWDMRETLKSYEYFRKKWDLDITGLGSFRKFLLEHNGALGLLPRFFPCQAALEVDRWLRRIQRLWSRFGPGALMSQIQKKILGYDEWPSEPS